MRKEIDLDISEFIGLELIDVESNRITFDQATLDLYCPWRIYNELIFMNSSVLVEKNNSEEAKRIVRKNLIGRKIESIKIFVYPCDMKIQLDQGITFEVFPDHPVYESWNLTFNDTDGRRIVGTPGGEVTWFLKEGEERK